MPKPDWEHGTSRGMPGTPDNVEANPAGSHHHPRSTGGVRYLWRDSRERLFVWEGDPAAAPESEGPTQGTAGRCGTTPLLRQYRGFARSPGRSKRMRNQMAAPNAFETGAGISILWPR